MVDGEVHPAAAEGGPVDAVVRVVDALRGDQVGAVALAGQGDGGGQFPRVGGEEGDGQGEGVFWVHPLPVGDAGSAVEDTGVKVGVGGPLLGGHPLFQGRGEGILQPVEQPVAARPGVGWT